MNPQKSVLIIGAGITGLTAGYELTKRGFSVTIVEKNATIGGLAGGFTIEGANLEQAYHHLFKTDTDILNLINELGLSGELGWYESKVAMIANKNDVPTQYPFNGAGDLLKYAPLPFLDRIRAGIVTLFLQKYSNWQKLKNQTALEWMNKWAGRVVTEKIWGMLLKGKFASFADKISMAWLWARIHIRTNSRKSILEKEMLAYPRNGFISITNKLKDKIEELGSHVLTNVSLEKISFKNNKYSVQLPGQINTFDAILSTVPTPVLEKLFATTQPLQNKPSQIDYLGAVVLAFSSSQSLSKFYWHTITDPNAPFLVFLQHTNLVPKSWYNEKDIYYIGAYVPQNSDIFAMAQSDVENLWFSYLSKIYPSFDVKQVLEKKLFKFSHAQHVVTTDYESKIPPYELSLPNLYQSNFAQIYPEDRGTNYSVREGKKVAAMIAEKLVYNPKSRV